MTIQATHAFTAAAGSNNVLDNVVAQAGNSAATGEPPTGLVLDLGGSASGWTVRNAVVTPTWNAVQPALTVTAAGGAVTAVTVGTQQGLGWDPYGTSVPVAFSGSCTAQATAAVNANGAIASVTVAQGGVGCSATTTASVNAAGTWDTAAAVNLIGGQDMTFFGGNLLKDNGGYTVWNATSSASYGTQLDGGGGTLPGGGTYAALVGNSKVGRRVPGGSVSGRGYRGEDPSVRERSECELRRHVRRAKFYGQLVDGIESDDRDGKYCGAAAVRDDCNGQPDCCDRGNAQRGAARVRAARTITTGWARRPCRSGLTSSVLTLEGLADVGASAGDTYALAMSTDAEHGHGAALRILVSRSATKRSVNTVGLNTGGTARFVRGPWKVGDGLGAYGFDPKTGIAWAVVNHAGMFALADR